MALKSSQMYTVQNDFSTLSQWTVFRGKKRLVYEKKHIFSSRTRLSLGDCTLVLILHEKSRVYIESAAHLMMLLNIRW
jgi:hypothetical protein